MAQELNNDSQAVLELLDEDRSQPCLMADELGWKAFQRVTKALHSLQSGGYVRCITPSNAHTPGYSDRLWSITDSGRDALSGNQ
jgi:hypothetical protein